jgi:hypothetical protein
MHAGWTKAFALAVLLAAAGLVFGQAGPGDAKKDDKADPNQPGDKAGKEAPKTKLEEMLQQALRNNPDIRVAEAKVAEAEAELNRTRLIVMQKVVLYNANLADAQAKVASAERLHARLVDTAKKAPGLVTEQDLQAAQTELQTAKANLAKVEAELPLLLGDKAQDKAIEKGLEWLRRYSLDKTGDPNAWRTASPELDRAAAEQWFKYLHTESVDTNTAFALAALATAGVKPPVQGPMAERIKKALDKPTKVDFNAIGPSDALYVLLEKVEGVPYSVRLKEAELAPELIHFRFDHEVPLGAAFQAYQDVCLPSVRFVVRDYGILVTDEKHMPPGATLLYDLWKSGQDKTSKKSSVDKIEGKVKAVDEKTKLLTISIGSDAGLKKGDTLEVYRLDATDTKYLGTLSVVDVKPTEAVAKALTAVKDDAPKVGDNVTNRLQGK